MVCFAGRGCIDIKRVTAVCRILQYHSFAVSFLPRVIHFSRRASSDSKLHCSEIGPTWSRARFLIPHGINRNLQFLKFS